MTRRSRLFEAVAVLVLLAALAVLFAGARKLYWMYDDVNQLRHADANTVDAYFVSPAFWKSGPAAMFVPGLFVLYEIGSRLGDASAFHLFTVALLLLALAACYLAMRRWLEPLPALAGIALIGLGAPTLAVVLEIMAIHYLAAVLFAALATLAFRRSVLSAFFYLLAILCKEIAIPLPALLFLLPAPDFRTRIRRVLPHALALAGYFVWRRLMIGQFLGGYGWAVTRENVGALLRSLPGALTNAMAPPSVILSVLLLLAILASIAWSLRSRPFAAAFALAVIVAVLPIVPVARELQPRYALALWITLAVFLAISLQRMPERVRPFLAASVVLLAALAQRAEWSEVFPKNFRMSEESRFAVHGPVDATLRNPMTPPAAMGETQWLRARSGVAPGLQWFYDDIQLCGDRHATRRLFEYDESRDAIVEISSRREQLTRTHCASIRESAPLQAEFRFENGTLFWDFGPYETGTWSVLFADGIQAFTIPRHDAFILGNIPGISLRVRYQSPEGWTTYSPEIPMDFTKESRFTWRR